MVYRIDDFTETDINPITNCQYDGYNINGI